MSRIIDKNKHLPKARMGDWFELQQNRKKLVERPIMKQSRRDGSIIIGAHALNKLMGPCYHRGTYDWDVKSPMPLRHGLQVERSIDRGTNSNLAYLEHTSYPVGGKKEPLVRVRLHSSDTVEVDYGLKKPNIRFVKRDGVRYETLNEAYGKYEGMISRGETHRFPNAFIDKGRIDSYRLIKNSKRFFRKKYRW